jgi:hypothetical protein
MAILQRGLLLSKREGSLDALALMLAMALTALCVFRALLMTRNTSFIAEGGVFNYLVVLYLHSGLYKYIYIYMRIYIYIYIYIYVYVCIYIYVIYHLAHHLDSKVQPNQPSNHPNRPANPPKHMCALQSDALQCAL